MSHHSQEITTPDGVQIHITLEDAMVSITDKDGSFIKFSAQLVPEVIATFHDVEKKFFRGLSNAHE